MQTFGEGRPWGWNEQQEQYQQDKISLTQVNDVATDW